MIYDVTIRSEKGIEQMFRFHVGHADGKYQCWLKMYDVNFSRTTKPLVMEIKHSEIAGSMKNMAANASWNLFRVCLNELAKRYLKKGKKYEGYNNLCRRV